MTVAIVRDPIYRGRRFHSEIIELCVRWYLTYRLSYRDGQPWLFALLIEQPQIIYDCDLTVSPYAAPMHRSNSMLCH
jgi:transposase-like protein